MSRPRGRHILIVVVGLLALLGLALGSSGEGARRLVLISIDGLRPEFYLDPAWGAATLRRLLDGGSAARAVEPVFPSVTYPGHATIATGVRPARHGIPFNQRFEPTGERGRWYEEAGDLRATPIWEWARAAGMRTAAVSWPVTLGARIDFLLPERDYYARPAPLDLLLAASTPGLFERAGVAPRADMFKDVTAWDAFLASTAAGILRSARPGLLLLHLVQLDYFQHRRGREGADVKSALARVDHQVAAVLDAVRDAGAAEATSVFIVGDHGFDDVSRRAFPNAILARAGLRGCPAPGSAWRATAHIAGAAAAVFVSVPGDAAMAARAEAVLRRDAGDRFAVLTRAELDQLGALPGAALGLEARPGVTLDGSCSRRRDGSAHGGTHGYLPSRPAMATGFVAAGAGVRAGVVLDRARLVDVAPTAARLLGLTPSAVEGRVLEEIVK